jgi:hypothetical protein
MHCTTRLICYTLLFCDSLLDLRLEPVLAIGMIDFSNSGSGLTRRLK